MNLQDQLLSGRIRREPANFRAQVMPSFGPSSRRIPGFATGMVLTTLLFAPWLVRLAVHASQSDLHSYIPLVPLVAGYLLYVRRDSLHSAGRGSPFVALVPAGIAAGSLIAALYFRPRLSPNDFLTLTTLAYVGLLAAGGFLWMGTAWMRSAAFPFAFLLFLVPLPDVVVEKLETASVLASTEAANLLLQVSGVPFLREGTVFALPTITLRVAQECSGIRSSWVLFITGVLASNVFLTTSWRRAALVFFVVPLGIVRNGFRILTIAMLCVHVGPQMIDSPIHHRGGPLFFALSLIPFFGFLRFLAKRERSS